MLVYSDGSGFTFRSGRSPSQESVFVPVLSYYWNPKLVILHQIVRRGVSYGHPESSATQHHHVVGFRDFHRGLLISGFGYRMRMEVKVDREFRSAVDH